MPRTKTQTATPPAQPAMPAGFQKSTPVPAAPQADWVRTRSPREIIERAILIITLVALGISVLVFLWAVNEFISIWFRTQWTPVARGVASLLVIVACGYVLQRLLARRRA